MGGRYYTECQGHCVRCDGRNRRNEKDRCVGGIEQEDAITGCWRMEGVEEDHTMVHLLSKVSQCLMSKGQNGMTAYGIDLIDIIGVIVGLTLE